MLNYILSTSKHRDTYSILSTSKDRYSLFNTYLLPKTIDILYSVFFASKHRDTYSILSTSKHKDTYSILSTSN